MNGTSTKIKIKSFIISKSFHIYSSTRYIAHTFNQTTSRITIGMGIDCEWYSLNKNNESKSNKSFSLNLLVSQIHKHFISANFSIRFFRLITGAITHKKKRIDSWAKSILFSCSQFSPFSHMEHISLISLCILIRFSFHK